MPTTVTWPVSTPTPSGPLTLNDPGAEPLGTDLLFGANGLQTGANGDYVTVTGEDNLEQAILRRLLVAPGEYKLNPDYGAGVLLYLKKPASQSNLDELTHRIRDQLSREKRIDSVDSVKVVDTTVNGQRAFMISIVVTSAGRTRRFRPFTLTDQAT